jgi:hypothetical protein
MSQHLSYVTLESIVQDYLTEGELPNHKYFKVWHLAYRGMEQLGLDAFYKIQTVKLPVNSNYTVVLPSDYVNWTKVGVLNDNGEIIPLYQNDKMTTFADLSSTRLEQTQDNTLWDWDVNNWNNYWNGQAFINIYGTPSGAPFVGSFKIDNENGVMLLDEKFKYDYVMIEYVASPQQGQEYYVPVQFREALIAWLWWKDKRAANTNRGQVGLSRDAKNDFFNERRNAIARWKPTRQLERYQASQEMTRLTVKS